MFSSKRLGIDLDGCWKMSEPEPDQSFLERFLRDLADIKVSIARIESKQDNINERMEVINHNTTDNATRLAVLEKGSQRQSDFKDFIVKLFSVLTAGAAMLASLHFLGVIPG